MEYDNDDNTWRTPAARKDETKCQQIPKKSTSMAVVVLGLAVLSCLLGYCVMSENLPYESKTLRLVVVLFRHGARTPLSSYNSDPYKNYQWPDGKGMLTNVGKMQLYELGKKYRSYYANFIPEEYLDKNVYVRSSDAARCLISAYTFLSGLFPPNERQTWNPEIPWQPIPVHSLPSEFDNVIVGSKPCKLYKAMYEEELAKANAEPEYADLFNYLTKYTNESMHSVLDVDYLYSCLHCTQEAGLKLPEWTKNVFPNKMRHPFMVSLALLSYNDTIISLKMGPFLEIVKQAMDKSSRHADDERSLLVFSGHDITVVALWRALGYSQLLEPEYGASIALELHEDVEQEAVFVKAFYRNNTKVEVPIELKLPFCEEPCPYRQFSDHISKFIPRDWDAACGNKA